ncbi:hypothetical protein HHK36_022017 [Tetracentron sinense]|uniref:Cytochrome P450 n=1 Tax=Tetracentron sinense TaxID=13715 RepID=A0A835D603_TETSI|nr:hypothetical protein HHK36_022017 [Tetracentron sinense]
MRARDVIRRDLLAFIKQRQIALSEGAMSPMHDLLTSLLTTTDENGRFLTANEITDYILLLLFSAHGTTSFTIAMLMRYLEILRGTASTYPKGGRITMQTYKREKVGTSSSEANQRMDRIESVLASMSEVLQQQMQNASAPLTIQPTPQLAPEAKGNKKLVEFKKMAPPTLIGVPNPLLAEKLD